MSVELLAHTTDRTWHERHPVWQTLRGTAHLRVSRQCVLCCSAVLGAPYERAGSVCCAVLCSVLLTSGPAVRVVLLCCSRCTLRTDHLVSFSWWQGRYPAISWGSEMLQHIFSPPNPCIQFQKKRERIHLFDVSDGLPSWNLILHNISG